MAQSMREIKDKISSTQSTSQITKAMQMVSAAKLTKSETKTKNYQSYMETLGDMIRNISVSHAVKHHPFFKPAKIGVTGYLVLTSDRGLAGGYNANVLKLLQSQLDTGKDFKLYAVGSKGFDYAKRRNLQVENEYVLVPDDLIYNDIRPAIDHILKDYQSGKIDEIVVIYNHFVSKLVQEPQMRKLLPMEPLEKGSRKTMVYTFEPNEGAVIDSLLPKYIEGTVYGLAITAKLSEQASRMNAMQNATDNAMDIIKDLKLIYNRARQAAITQEINEIVGGASAI